MFQNMIVPTGPKDAVIVNTGTLNTSATSTEHTIDTGLGNDLTHFFMHGPSTNSYGDGIQEFVRWENTFGNNFYFGGAYSGGGVSKYSTFTSTADVRGTVIVSISNGIVTVKSASNSNWSNIAFTWYAW